MFTKEFVPQIINLGQKMAKKRNPVYLLKQDKPFEVETREGVLKANAGDYIAHDPISGDIWPISAEYVKINYEMF